MLPLAATELSRRYLLTSYWDKSWLKKFRIRGSETSLLPLTSRVNKSRFSFFWVFSRFWKFSSSSSESCRLL